MFEGSLSTPLILFLCILIIQSPCSKAIDTLYQSEQLLANQTLISSRQIFEIGFFNPGNSSRQYLGLWHKTIPQRKIFWVANRDRPLDANDTGSILKIGPDGNLRLEDGKQNVVWSTNVSVESNRTVAVITNEGNFILRDNVSASILWQSYDYPGDTLLPGMRIFSTTSGEKRYLSSWKAENDPSPGEFLTGPAAEQPPQLLTWNGSIPRWRSGPWNGLEFLGIVYNVKGYALGFDVGRDQQGTVHFAFNTLNASYLTIMVLIPSGSNVLMTWNGQSNRWIENWKAPNESCDLYGMCGPFGICNLRETPICQCLKGYVPRSNEEWTQGIWSGGCVRRTPLQCERNGSDSETDGFQLVREMKLPDHFEYLIDVDSVEGCEEQCLSNCSCVAYAYPDGIRCMVWRGELIDSHLLPSEGEGDLFLRLAYSEIDTPGEAKKNTKLIISVTTVSAAVLLAISIYCFRRWKSIQRGGRKKNERDSAKDDRAMLARNTSELQISEDPKFMANSSDLPIIDFAEIASSTDNFSLANKLGEGGFGPVYKGKTESGQDIAVKRLSRHSGQGIEEFKNEILLISKLQHRNLVRLLGCCIHGEERLLVYEYMKNRSLDAFIFDSTKKLQLDWAKRLHIIQGVARGILYLHRDSLLRIIHRDLKASNVLLDGDMNPKISDFGLARTFRVTQEQGNTHRVVGTFGYMSPEYAIWGLFSEKSDVYSFGVLMLEIVSGRKNTGFIDENYVSLLGYAWKLWDEGNGLDLVDETLTESTSTWEVLRCIHIGLLCVQDQPTDRPTMSDVVLMLSSEALLPKPKQPAFTLQSWLDSTSGSSPNTFSVNSANMSMIESSISTTIPR